MKSRLKNKKTIIVLSIIFVAGCWFILEKLEIVNPPSAQMVLLRETERSLNLPEPYQRSEEDKGCYTDTKGALQCSRHIFYHYQTGNHRPAVEAYLRENQWKYFESENIDGINYLRAWNGNLRSPVCISHRSNSDSSASSIFITAEIDRGCEYTIEKLSKDQ